MEWLTYHTTTCMYCLTVAAGTSRVFLVSPDTLTEVRSLKGSFSSPRNVCVGDINGVTTIVVSDYGSDKLFLYTVDGELIKTYGPSTTSGLRDLCMDRKVSLSPRMDILLSVTVIISLCTVYVVTLGWRSLGMSPGHKRCGMGSMECGY